MSTGGDAVGYRARILSRRVGWPTTYEIQIELPGGGSKTINRRYNDFVRLREGLLQLGDLRGTLPTLPPKALMVSSSRRDSRQEDLQCFLAEALSRSRMDSEAWRIFLEIPAGEVILEEANPTATTEPTTLPEPRSELDEIRRIRQMRWSQQRGTAAAEIAVTEPSVTPSSSSTAPAPVTADAVAPSVVQPEELTRVSLLPLQEIPSDIDSEEMRHAAIVDNLKYLREQETIVEAGMVLTTSMGYKFAVIKCAPDRGFITVRTLNYVNGPVLPVLRTVEFVGLREHRRGERESASRKQLMDEHIMPHFRNVFAESRVGVVGLNEIQQFSGVQFEVTGLDPNTIGWGLVNSSTTIHARLHQLPEFTRIHVTPFSDTLPSAYQFDIFQDYVKPFFRSNPSRSFQEGDTFRQNGVHFKVVATEPAGRVSCRVGSSTVIYTEGVLHPSASELLAPEQQRQLALLPPPLQMLLLQTTYFGDGEVAERIMEAQTRRSQRTRGVSSSALDSMTEEVTWSQELHSQLNIEQTECVVCVQEFQEGDRVRLLPCNHVFHTACVDEWLGREAHCPLCRYNLRTRRQQQQQS